MRTYHSFFIGAALSTLTACGTPSPEPDVAANVESESSEGKLWVTSERLDRHTCAAETCGVVGQLFFREAATPLENKAEWVRITKIYDAACEGGKSQYVDKGNAACLPSNGIVNGKFSEWVRSNHLSKTRPADPALTAKVDETLVAESDDFQKYRKPFAKLAAQLIADGRCTEADFKEMGGWVKSVNEHRDKPVYFTYCGGMTAANKIYINAETTGVMP
jgi:hypothetical protein